MYLSTEAICKWLFKQNQQSYQNDFFFVYFSTQNGSDGAGKDDLDSGDEADGKKIDTEEVTTKRVKLLHNKPQIGKSSRNV